MTETRRNNRILVGVDGSDSSMNALREASRIATALNAPLMAITVWDYPVMVEYYLVEDWSPEEVAKKSLAATIQQAFDGAAPPELTTSVVQGRAARVLIEQSKQSGMLVLGSRGHGGFVGMLLGSVSAACAEHAHCPVLIVRSSRTEPSITPEAGDVAMDRQEQK